MKYILPFYHFGLFSIKRHRTIKFGMVSSFVGSSADSTVGSTAGSDADSVVEGLVSAGSSVLHPTSNARISRKMVAVKILCS